jgi:hypothetical protein
MHVGVRDLKRDVPGFSGGFRVKSRGSQLFPLFTVEDNNVAQGKVSDKIVALDTRREFESNFVVASSISDELVGLK